MATHEVPEHLRRYPSRAGRDALAARLGLTIEPDSQDWEWLVADPACFDHWLAVYRNQPLSDEERFSLMEMPVQCVEMAWHVSAVEVEEMPEWRAVSTLLQERPRLHASTIAYWSLFERDDPEEVFGVSVPMRRVWEVVELALGSPRNLRT